MERLSQVDARRGSKDLVASGDELRTGGFNLGQVGRAHHVRQEADPQWILSQPVGLSRLHMVWCLYPRNVISDTLSALSLGLCPARLLARYS